MMHQKGNVAEEVATRIARAASIFGRLRKRVWDNRSLSQKTKLRIYHTCVISALLYGSETLGLHVDQERRLNHFHLKCLRLLLGIHWKDKVPDRRRVVGVCAT